MNIIRNYINNYDFAKHIKSTKLELSEEKYKNFSEEFWKNPNVNLNKLKSKYNIPSSISFKDILQQHHTIQYENLIKDCWSENLTIDNLVEKYGIKLHKIEQLLFPIPFHIENYICPHCLTSELFIMENNIKNLNYMIHCNNCKSIIENFISEKEANLKKETLEENIKKFETYIKTINDKLTEIKCPKCQEKMHLLADKTNLTFKINCTKCSVIYTNYTDLLKDCESFKQRAAMMIKIKAKEDELVNNFLKKKKPEEVKIKVEELIIKEESICTIGYLIEKDYSDNNEAFIDLLKNIKLCTRLEKRVLITICELINENPDNLSNWKNKHDTEPLTQTKFIKPEEPLVSFLLNETKIIIIRKTLRNLIKNKLIYCCEKENEIHVHTSLIDNLDSIKNLLKPQHINNELSHLIFNKQKYTCYHCGETGRPLKIAYLSADKDKNNISSMIGICDLCYYDVTENEILIDGMITGLEEYSNESPVCWKFLISNYSDFQHNDEAYSINENFLEKHTEADIIKAYAATIDKFIREGKRGNFFAYAEAILNNSENGVIISKKIIINFNINEWLSKLN